MAGNYSDASWFVKRAIEIFQPIFEGLLEETTRVRYSGHWKGDNDAGASEIVVALKQGMLWITRCIVDGKTY
jgi:hypothetical protein